MANSVSSRSIDSTIGPEVEQEAKVFMISRLDLWQCFCDATHGLQRTTHMYCATMAVLKSKNVRTVASCLL